MESKFIELYKTHRGLVYININQIIRIEPTFEGCYIISQRDTFFVPLSVSELINKIKSL